MGDSLEQHLGDAIYDSSGRFSVDRARALRKLRKFLLPSPSLWVLKVVQAAVASGARYLSIDQSPSSTDFFFLPDRDWCLDHFESALLNAEDGRDRGLNHLKRGLWSVSPQVDGFSLTPARSVGENEALVWDGQTLRRVARAAREQLVLSVHHANVDAAWRKDVARELRQRAHFCSISLQFQGQPLDGRRADGLLAYQFFSAPLAGQCQLSIPPGAYQQEALRCPPLRPERAGAVCFLSLAVNSKVTRYEHRIHWVLDGVIVDSQLMASQALSLCCDFYLSAEQKQLDISGFRLAARERDPELEATLRTLFRPGLQGVRIDLSGYIRRVKRQQVGRFLGLGTAGMALFSMGALGLGTVVGGAALYTALRARGGAGLEKELQTYLDLMLQSWA
ncbi:MAG: hypothetical protein U0931_27215 [Vulcanimicrobiota bacterium]